MALRENTRSGRRVAGTKIALPAAVTTGHAGIEGRDGRMTPSTFIARILGPVLVIIGLCLLLEGEAFRVMAGEFVRNAGMIYLSGIISIAVGLAILNVHHLWVADWRVLVTIFGWLALIGGIFRVLATSVVQRVGDKVITHPRWLVVGAVGTLVLGGFLTIMGYRDAWADTGRRPAHRSAASRSGATKSGAAKSPKRTGRKTKASSPDHHSS